MTKKGIDILYYLYKTKQWILDLKMTGQFKKVITEGEELVVFNSKIIKCNNLIGKPLQNYLAKQIELFEKEETRI